MRTRPCTVRGVLSTWMPNWPWVGQLLPDEVGSQQHVPLSHRRGLGSRERRWRLKKGSHMAIGKQIEPSRSTLGCSALPLSTVLLESQRTLPGRTWALQECQGSGQESSEGRHHTLKHVRYLSKSEKPQLTLFIMGRNSNILTFTVLFPVELHVLWTRVFPIRLKLRWVLCTLTCS